MNDAKFTTFKNTATYLMGQKLNCVALAISNVRLSSG